MENILIFGASGFLGKTLLARLIKDKSYDRLVVVTHHTKICNLPDDVISISLNIESDYDEICNIIAKYEITQIYHFASSSIVKQCANDPRNSYKINVMGTVNILDAVRNVGLNTVKRVLISTSDKVYGHSPTPYTETTPFTPKYTYETTKSCQDFVAQNYFHNYDVPINIVRFSNIYGPGDNNYSRIVPNTIRRLKSNIPPVLNSGVANFVREFIHVEDAADCCMFIVSNSIPGESFCVGGNEQISMYDLIKKICTLMKYDGGIEIVQTPKNLFEIETQFMDSSKIHNLGWSPKFSLDDGLLSVIRCM